MTPIELYNSAKILSPDALAILIAALTDKYVQITGNNPTTTSTVFSEYSDVDERSEKISKLLEEEGISFNKKNFDAERSEYARKTIPKLISETSLTKDEIIFALAQDSNFSYTYSKSIINRILNNLCSENKIQKRICNKFGPQRGRKPYEYYILNHNKKGNNNHEFFYAYFT